MTEETLKRANELTAKIEKLRIEYEGICLALDNIDKVVDIVRPLNKDIEPIRITTVRGDYRVTVTRAEWEAMLTTAKNRLLSDIAKCRTELEAL